MHLHLGRPAGRCGDCTESYPCHTAVSVVGSAVLASACSSPALAACACVCDVAIVCPPYDMLLPTNAPAPAGIGSPAMQGRIALQLLLPALLYHLLPCEWTSWLALCTLCDDPLSQDTATEFLRLAMR